jgi:acyl-CoA synthetase (AMP-forming)/AMP-acid ligase II
VTAPAPNRLGRRLARHATGHGEARAVYVGDRWWTYRELVDAAEAQARALAVGAGDVVAVVMARGIEPVVAVCACALVGAVPAMIDPADAELAARCVTRLKPAAVVGAADGAITWQPVARPGLALVIFTSGSTADGKAVAWSEVRLAHDWTSTPPTPLQRAGPGGVAVPLSSALGIQDVIRNLWHGLATVLLAVPFRVGLEQARGLGVNRLRLTPTHVDVLLASDVALPAVKSVAVASAPIKRAKLRALADRLPGARVGRSYGLSESGAATAVWMDKTPGRMHTVGRPVAFRRVTVRDADGNLVPPRTWGEVVIDMPVWDAAAGDGYLDAAEPLAARFRNGTLWTGDRGKLDGRGFLVLGARHAEILKVGGRSVGARRIEEALRAGGELDGLAVVGVPEPALGEVPCAVYVPGDGVRVAEAAATAATRVRADEVPRWWLPRVGLPRAGNGKLRRGVLAGECARWTSAFDRTVAEGARMYAAYWVDGRCAVVDGGVAPWFAGDGASGWAAAGRLVALVLRKQMRVLAVGYLQAGVGGVKECRVVLGPFAARSDDGEVAGELVDVFGGELLRLAAVLPGPKPTSTYVRAERTGGYAQAGFAAREAGWWGRGAVVAAEVFAGLDAVAARVRALPVR